MLRGRTALVTGAQDGIGLAIAQALAAQGCAVTRTDIADDPSPGYYRADLADMAQIDALSRAIGPVDILVNNAVTRHNAEVESLPLDKWQHAIAVNLTAPFRLIQLTLPGMKERRWGRIINLASTYGLIGTPRRADYVSTKHALVGLTRVVALEAAQFNVTCNALCPAAVATQNTRKLVAERQAKTGESAAEAEAAFLAARQPTRRLVTPQRIAALAVFLCSEDAADMTGTPIPIDGAWLSRA